MIVQKNHTTRTTHTSHSDLSSEHNSEHSSVKSRINESNGTRNAGSERDELPSANKFVEENEIKGAEVSLENTLTEPMLCVLVT